METQFSSPVTLIDETFDNRPMHVILTCTHLGSQLRGKNCLKTISIESNQDQVLAQDNVS